MGLAFVAFLLLMLFALAVYAYLGTFTRYVGDDYCSASALATEGFWGAQSYWWRNWSGRYSFSFAISFVELFGVSIVPVLPALILSLWLISAVWACLPLLRVLKISNPVFTGMLIASISLWLTYRSVNDYPQIVFWQTGILTYPVSPILFLLGVGISVRYSFPRGAPSWRELFLWFLFAFLAGGFSETGVVMQITLLALTFVLIKILKKIPQKKYSPILVSALCGSVLSLIVIAASPGNAVRSGGFQSIPPLGHSLPGSLAAALIFIPSWIDSHTIIFLFGLLAGAFFVYFGIHPGFQADNVKLAQYFALSLMVVETGIWAGIAPAYLLRGEIPPERVLLFPYFLLAGSVMYWGALGALFLRSNLPSSIGVYQVWASFVLLIVVASWSVGTFAVSQVRLVQPLMEYARLWDARHLSLLAASQNNESNIITADLSRVESLRELGTRLWLTGDFEADPAHWVNFCAAQYYGVGQISAR